MNVLNGKNSRNNKIQRLVMSEPLKRLDATTTTQGLIQHYAFALGWTVDFMVKSIAGEDSAVPVYAQVGKTVNEAALVRLAAYLAYRLQTLFLSDNPEFYLNPDGTEHEASKAILEDVERVCRIMYPCDSAVTDAIARHLEIEGTSTASTSLHRQVKEVAIYDDLLGAPHADNLDATRRNIPISVAIAGARRLIVETLDTGLAKL